MNLKQHLKRLLACSACAMFLCVLGYTADRQVINGLTFSTPEILNNYQQLSLDARERIPAVLGPLGVSIYGNLSTSSIPELSKIPKIATLTPLTEWIFIDNDEERKLHYLAAGIPIMNLQDVNESAAVIYGPMPERIAQLAGNEKRLPLTIPAGINGHISFQKLKNGHVVLALNRPE